MPPRWHVCSHPSCPELVNRNEPCPRHGRPTNAPWSTDRDPRAHDRWQRRVKARDHHRCQRCGATTELHAHHITPGSNTLEAGITLCRTCHRAIDTHAR